jgi:hypothetical protein
MKQSILAIAAASALIAIPASADDQDRDEFYKSMLSCAAFHTIEASKSTGSAVDAQQALAVEFAQAAVHFASDGKLETADADLKTLLDDFQNKLDTGNPREMAEQWTNTEFACSDLYAAKDGLVRARKKELAGAKPAN